MPSPSSGVNETENSAPSPVISGASRLSFSMSASATADRAGLWITARTSPFATRCFSRMRRLSRCPLWRATTSTTGCVPVTLRRAVIVSGYLITIERISSSVSTAASIVVPDCSSQCGGRPMNSRTSALIGAGTGAGGITVTACEGCESSAGMGG